MSWDVFIYWGARTYNRLMQPASLVCAEEVMKYLKWSGSRLVLRLTVDRCSRLAIFLIVYKVASRVEWMLEIKCNACCSAVELTERKRNSRSAIGAE